MEKPIAAFATETLLESSTVTRLIFWAIMDSDKRKKKKKKKEKKKKRKKEFLNNVSLYKTSRTTINAQHRIGGLLSR